MAPLNIRNPGARRSPAEKAFDLVLLPSAFYLLFTLFLVFAGIGAEDSPPASATMTPFLAVMSLAAGIHWAYAARAVARAWRDPFGKVLRFASVGLLALEALPVLVFLATFLPPSTFVPSP